MRKRVFVCLLAVLAAFAGPAAWAGDVAELPAPTVVNIIGIPDVSNVSALDKYAAAVGLMTVSVDNAGLYVLSANFSSLDVSNREPNTLKIWFSEEEAISGISSVEYSIFNASNENLGSKDIDPADLGTNAYLAMKLPVGISSLIATVDAKKSSDNSGDNNGPTSTKYTVIQSGDHSVLVSGDVSIPFSGDDSSLLDGNSDAAPDLENPEANDAAPEQVDTLEGISDNSSGSSEEAVQAGAYTEPLEATSLDITAVYNVVGDTWPGATFRSVSNDMDQTDNRGTSEKTLVARNAVEAAQATLGTGKKIAFAYVLRPMKPKKTGIFTFALPLAADMVTGHHLIWSVSRSARVGMVQAAGVSLAADDTTAVFIDTTTGKKITDVPESRAVTVSTYLDEKYDYEPVVLTETDTDEDKSPTSNKGSGGCNAGLGGLALMALCGLVARKK